MEADFNKKNEEIEQLRLTALQQPAKSSGEFSDATCQTNDSKWTILEQQVSHDAREFPLT